MRANRALTLFGYYGGKARLAKYIAELLDYDNTDVYIEPFGGAGSVLLNKPPHKVEIYSDLSRGLVALMDCLSNPETAEELIAELYETDYSEDCFNQCLEYKKSLDSGMLSGIDYIEFAKATYVTYAMSRDGMAQSFSKNKFISNEHYYRGIDKLYAVADRLNGVIVSGAVNMFMYTLGTTFDNDLSAVIDEDTLKSKLPDYKIKEIIDGNIMFNEYISSNTYSQYDNERTMMYLDPPYLSEDTMQDLGRVYTGKLSKEIHKQLLETILKSRARILISNYDNELYSSMLKDWNKIEIDISTSVGGTANNKRTECLWYNY